MEHCRARRRGYGLARYSVGALIVIVGCGMIADKDRIKIAEIEGTSVTRGDLMRLIREMPDEERPLIRSKGDLLRELNKYLDNRIKEPLGEQLAQEGKINVPREVAAMLWDRAHPDWRQFLDAQNLSEYNLTEADRKVMKEEREDGIDRIHRKLQGETAVHYLTREGRKNGTLTIPEEECRRQYQLRSNELKYPEQMDIAGFCFPSDPADKGVQASVAAAAVLKRMTAGEDLSKLAQELAENQVAVPFQTRIPNDPRMPQYAGFWDQASGASRGAILGPLFISGWPIGKSEDGRTAILPDGFLVCVVLARTDERPKTFEEAKEELMEELGYAKTIERLRQEKGVKVFDQKLPDPSEFDENRADSIFDQ